MKCVSPVSIKDPRKKRGSLRLTVPCGYCGACRHNRRVEWSYRLKVEFKNASSAYFITLTYSNENIPYNTHGLQTLCKRDVQLFIKRLRKHQNGNEKSNIRYYLVGEYGTRTDRPHYHILLFNLNPSLINVIDRIWNLGHIDVGQVNDASIHYVTKYHVNYDKKLREQEEREPEFAIMSRNPGIGYQYLEKGTKYNRDSGNVFIMNNGYAQRMPRYYKNKIFSETEREILADEAMTESEKAYWSEFKRLYDLGIEDPDDYMEKSAYIEASKVQKKSNSNDIF